MKPDLKAKIGSMTVGLVEMKTEAQSRKGLSGKKHLPYNIGYLFHFPNLSPSITMEKTYIPLDILFIDQSGSITDIAKGEPFSKDLIEGEGAYVIELNLGFCKDHNIQPGDKVKIMSKSRKPKLLKKGSKNTSWDGGAAKVHTQKSHHDRKKEEIKWLSPFSKDPGKGPLLRYQEGGEEEEGSKDMYLLDDEGVPQMKMKGGELIFSIKNTKIISSRMKAIDKEKDKNKKLKLITDLGKLIIKYRNIQRNNKPEYVTE